MLYDIGYVMHIELKVGVSIRKFLDESKKIIDGQILNEMTQTRRFKRLPKSIC